jgi:hypothetical protein
VTLLIPVILAQMLASTAPTDRGALPARGTIDSARGDVDGDGKVDDIRIEQRRTGVFLVVETAAGRRAEKGLGIEPLGFSLDGTRTRLALADVDTDGTPEILAGAAVGDRALLFVLSFDAAADVAPLRSLRSGDDSFVSDRGAGPDSIRVSRAGRIDIATLRPSNRGAQSVREQFDWNADARDFVWSDTVAGAQKAPFAGFKIDEQL